ncbi:MAG TPA: DUF4236 domain-containing protein [Beutenbergiaceae bacterium]|nr:DUF4236 domain-containing protein [Beutenbergiaceae bacterium]
MFVFRRRIRIGKNLHLNVSKRGVGVSARVGRVTVNNRGRNSVRLFRGLSFKF